MRRRKRQDEGDEEGKRALNEDDGPETLINKHNAIRVSFLVIPILFILWATTCTSLEKDAGEEMMGLNDFTETDLGKTGTPSSTSSTALSEARRSDGIRTTPPPSSGWHLHLPGTGTSKRCPQFTAGPMSTASPGVKKTTGHSMCPTKRRG